MILTPGIQLHSEGYIDLQDRVKLSYKSIPIDQNQFYKIQTDYSEHAYVPLPDWQKVSSQQLEIIKNRTEDLFYKELVQLVNLPNNVIGLLKSFNFHTCQSLNEVHQAIQSNQHLAHSFQLALHSYLKSFEIPATAHDTHIHGFTVSNADMPTLAMDKTKKYLGLHIDYCEGSHQLREINTVNRMCINLSEEPRFFMYINKSVKELIKMVNLHDPYDFYEHYNSVDLPTLTQKFFQYYSDYPIIQFKVNPYEAYIAPTDNMIHDGSSVGMMHKDITIVILGHFQLKSVLPIC